MKNIVLMLGIIIVSFSGCSKSTSKDETNSNTNLSAADKISGLYKGTGKFLPGNISLGTTVICTPPPTDYNSLYQTGDASINISKLTDSTVKIVLLSGPFPQDTYNSILLKVAGNTIEFNDSLAIISRSAGFIARVKIGSGYFDPATKTIAFSRPAPNFNYSFSFSCYTGLPYYTSFSVPDASTGLMVYANYTTKRYEFSGTKQ